MKIVVFIVIVLLNGCTNICLHSDPSLASERTGFSSAFDVFQATHKIDKLQQFVSDYPDSEWAARATTIVSYSVELDQRKLQVVSLREFRLQQADSLEEIKALNLQLTKQLEQFKILLIRMESHQQQFFCMMVFETNQDLSCGTDNFSIDVVFWLA